MSDFLDLQGAKDLNVDAIHISAVANSKDPTTGAAIDTHVNRVGGTDYTLQGFWNAIGPVVMPWTSVAGGTLTQPNQAFLHPANGNYYSWVGAYPVGGYVVAPGTDPTLPGSGYVPRTDASFRYSLGEFTSLVFSSIADMKSGTLISGEHHTLADGESALVLGEISAIFEIKSSGVVDDIDVFSVSGGALAHRVSSLAGDQYYSYKQRHMLAEALKKLRERTATTFTWYGDSNSVRNSAGVQTAFREMLQGAYGVSAVNLVINRAASGLSAKAAFDTYTTSHSGDISVINFGTNDATTQAGYPSLTGNLQQYLYWIERLIIRELNWGKPVVLVTPLPTRFDKAWETYTYGSPSDPYPTFKRIDAYQMGNSLKYLAAKYSIPVIDSVELMAYFKDEMFYSSTQSINVKTPFGDPVHLADGYSQAWGARIAAQFIGDLVMRSPTVFDGDMLNVTHGASPVIVNSSRNPDAVYQYYADAVEAAFAQGDDHVGNRSLVIQQGERVTFSFYTGQDNMIIYPTMMVFDNSNILTFIDNRSFQPQVKIDNSVTGTSYGPIEFTQITTSNFVVNRPVGLSALSTRGEANNSIWVPTKGWHTLTILCNTGYVAVSGLNFMTYLSDEFIKYKQRNPIGLYSFVVNYLDGDIADSEANGLMQYAFPSSTGKPTGVDAGFFIHQDNSGNDDGTISIIRFYESTPTAGRVWIKQRISGSWGSWVQV